MKFTGCHLAGLYPRSDQLFTTMKKYARRELSREELLSAVREELREIIKNQRSAGMTILIEGQLLWHDLFRPFSESIPGIEPGPLTRWFDNNVFYKKPVIVGELRWERPVVKDYLILEAVKNDAWKVVVPEAYTFAFLSDNKHYERFDDLVIAIADIIARELSYLEDVSRLVMAQLSAPVLVQKRLDRDSAELVRQGIEMVKKSFGGEVLLHTYFNDFSNALPWILDSGADILGMDMTSTSIDKLSSYDIDRPVYVGIVDSRNSYVESVDELVSTAEMVLDKLDPPSIHIGTSADLDFLPRIIADKKVAILGEAYRRLRDA